MNHPITLNSTAITRSPYPAAGPVTVKAALTPKRPRPVAGNDAYAAFAHRVLAAYARRIARGDIDSLSLLTGLAADIDAAIGQAVTGLREFGYSWADIGARLGVTRQAASNAGEPSHPDQCRDGPPHPRPARSGGLGVRRRHCFAHLA